jgi:hypothetical protein
MRFKLLVLALLLLSCVTLPSRTFASTGTDFTNSGGTLSGTNAGLSLSGSTLIAISGFNGGGLVTGDLGTVTFSTGALQNGGSLAMGGSFGAGGSFTISGNGTNGIPNTVLFSGSFSGPVTWTLVTLCNGTHNYTLTGVVTGTMGGMSVNGVSVQSTVNTGKAFFEGSTEISGGDTTVEASVPEPSSLALFGTGLLLVAGTMRRKVLAH